MASNDPLADMEAELRRILEANHKAFEGKYREEINALLGLSREEIDKITPDTTDLETYDRLMVVVKDASTKNLKQAELKERILRLGDLAVRIAKRVPSLATLLG